MQHGYTPLILATKLKSVRMIEVLHEHGADVNVKTKEVCLRKGGLGNYFSNFL